MVSNNISKKGANDYTENYIDRHIKKTVHFFNISFYEKHFF